MKIIKTGIPDTTSVLAALDRNDYTDAFYCKFNCSHPVSIDDVIHAFFDSAPSWVHHMFTIRDVVASKLGLKTISRKEREQMRKSFSIQPGNSIGLFKVLSKSEEEVIMGEDDKHLNFRVAFLLNALDAESYALHFITTVKIHNWLGKLYFLPVKPMHALVVKSMMKGTVKRIVKQSTSLP